VSAFLWSGSEDNAGPEEINFDYRISAGLLGGIIHVLYIAAFLLDKGQSIVDTLNESPNNSVKVGNTT
jgi:hypothetical protein